MGNFKIGEKVVCIDNTPKNIKLIQSGFIYPEKGEIYTIRHIFISSTNELTFYLNEIKNAPMETVVGFIEVGFAGSRFRKLDYEFAENLLAEISQAMKSETIKN